MTSSTGLLAIGARIGCAALIVLLSSGTHATAPKALVAQAGVTGDPTTPESQSQDDVLFVALDKNHDGFLTETEANDEVADFSKADADGNGRLNPTEFDTARTGGSSAGGIDADPNNDTD